MKRREFIALFGSLAAWSSYAYGQQSAAPIIGFLNSGTRIGREHFVDAFHEGLKEGGFTTKLRDWPHATVFRRFTPFASMSWLEG